MEDLIYKARCGDRTAMSNLLENNVGLIWSIVRRFLNRGYEREDLFQIGCIGFIKAVQRFDTNYATQFSTYAVPMIMGEIKRFIRDDGPIKVSRGLKELSSKILQIENYSEMSTKELSQILNVSEENILMSLESSMSLESLDREISDGDDRNILDTVKSSYDEFETLVSNISLNAVLNKLNENEKKVILMRYFRDKTQSETAKATGVSQVQVSRIEKKALEKMKMMLL